jgi:hypothetical protein
MHKIDFWPPVMLPVQVYTVTELNRWESEEYVLEIQRKRRRRRRNRLESSTTTSGGRDGQVRTTHCFPNNTINILQVSPFMLERDPKFLQYMDELHQVGRMLSRPDGTPPLPKFVSSAIVVF